MIDLGTYKDRFAESGQRVFEQAVGESRRRDQNYIAVEHILNALATEEADLFNGTMRDLSLDPRSVKVLIEQRLEDARYQNVNKGIRIAPETIDLFKKAMERARAQGRKTIEATDLFMALSQDEKSIFMNVLRNLGANTENVIENVRARVLTREQQEEDYKKKFDLPPYLKHFGVSLNRLARADKIAPTIGRELEIRQMIEILCHKERANSPMLVGEPGVGKTAVVEGLARLIELEPEKLPARLRGAHIVQLQMGGLVAGTMLRGMFEERIKGIIDEVKERDNLVLFIDEAHTIIGAGAALGTTSDAANMFKSALARGEMRIIGATTVTEYKEYIGEDEALARRFRLVNVAEPSLQETREILFGVRPRLERNYSVTISDDAINTALEMAPKYIRNLHMPDKPIGWLDTAAVKVEMNELTPIVRPEHIIEVISQQSRIPRDMIFRDTDRFALMEEEIGHRVIGQKDAVRAVAHRLRVNKGPLKESHYKPDGVLLFLGPTGVGKTELAKAVAECMFGDEEKMIRIDMSEYSEGSIGIEKLLGMPRGIVGSERGGILTEKLRDNPYTVVLLDEVEKASLPLMNLFLQVFDEGWMTDGRGKKVYFSDAIIIMTSNLGSESWKKYENPLGFDMRRSTGLKIAEGDRAPELPNISAKASSALKAAKNDVQKAAEKHFSPEFLNRIDETIIFQPLTKEEVKQIAGLYLGKLRQLMEHQGKSLFVTESALAALADKGYSSTYGARFLKRHIDEKIKVPLTAMWKSAPRFIADVEEGEVVVKLVSDGIETATL